MWEAEPALHEGPSALVRILDAVWRAILENRTPHAARSATRRRRRVGVPSSLERWILEVCIADGAPRGGGRARLRCAIAVWSCSARLCITDARYVSVLDDVIKSGPLGGCPESIGASTLRAELKDGLFNSYCAVRPCTWGCSCSASLPTSASLAVRVPTSVARVGDGGGVDPSSVPWQPISPMPGASFRMYLSRSCLHNS